MPKLLAFLICEKVIIEKQHDTPSLISIAQTVVFQVAPGAPAEIPKDAVAPYNWSAFSVWLSEDTDIGKKFVQQIEIILPDGSIGPVKTDLPFVQGDRMSFNAINGMGFPVGLPGIVKFKMWLESESGEILSPEYFYPIE